MLSEPLRKHLIKIIVASLLEYQKKINCQLLSTEKCAYAALVIEIFPLLKNLNLELGYVSVLFFDIKNPKTEIIIAILLFDYFNSTKLWWKMVFYLFITLYCYYRCHIYEIRRCAILKRVFVLQEHYYDPKTGKGFIATGLSNARRNKSHKKELLKKKQEKNTNLPTATIQVDETDEIKDAIAFLKSAAPDQKEAIIAKTRETFAIRRFLYLNTILTTFPRFKDTPELVRISILLWVFLNQAKH